jgi:pyrroloquinoline quinone (PQQ) biosynthesis protein C
MMNTKKPHKSPVDWEAVLEPAATRMLAFPWRDAECYRGFIAQLFHFTRYSTRMLAAAAANTDSREFYKRLVSHIREEEGHEKLALADLKAMGGDIADYPELGITRALWEPQFFKIQRQPKSLLGYILSLELFPVRCYPEVLPVIRQVYGEKCVNFIRVHCEEDPTHVQDAIRQIELASEMEQNEIVKNFIQTTDVVVYLLDEVTKVAQLRSQDHQVTSHLVKRPA